MNVTFALISAACLFGALALFYRAVFLIEAAATKRVDSLAWKIFMESANEAKDETAPAFDALRDRYKNSVIDRCLKRGFDPRSYLSKFDPRNYLNG
jgi:hypothetical protein